MFGTVLWNRLKQWFCLTLDDSQLEKHGGIEHRIGILLEGEYPLILTSTDRRPAADGLLSRDSPVLMVADDAAQQTVVGSRHIVVVVEQDGGQRRSIDTEYLFVRDLRCQLRVQRVDALHDQYLLLLQLQFLAALLTGACGEVITRQLPAIRNFQCTSFGYVLLWG